MAGEALRARRALLQLAADEQERERAALLRHHFDQERLQVAHEVHDVVGHALVAINVRSSAAAHLARKRGDGAQITALDEIASTSADALAELRHTLKALRSDQDPVPLRRGSPLADLGDLLAGVQGPGSRVQGPGCRADRRPRHGLGAGLGPNCGRPRGVPHIQESLTNVLRHSEATRATVTIGQRNGTLLVEIVDQGRQRVSTVPSGGHGVRGMRERAAALGGRCDAGTLEGGRWQVRAEIPLPADPLPADQT